MKRWWKYLLIAAVILYSVWLLFPSVRYYSMPGSEREALSEEDKNKYLDSVIKLGLDLQGGMHLVLEIDDSELDADAKKDVLDRAIRIIRNRVDQFGVAEPIIQKQGSHRIIVQLPGLEDPDRAKGLIGQTALLKFIMVREPEELMNVVNDLDIALKGVKVEGMTVDTTGVEQPDSLLDASTAGSPDDTTTIATTDTDTSTVATAFDSLIPTIPGTEELDVPLAAQDPDKPFQSLFVTAYNGAIVADERHLEKINLLLTTEQAKRVMPRDTQFLWTMEALPLQGGGEGYLLYLVESREILTGARLVNATTRPDPDDPSTLNVSFQLDREGALIFSRVTGENIGRRIAITLDNKIQSAPVVQSKIPGGEGRITGQFTDEEANDLAIVLRAGALPVPIEIEEERTVGPTLGHDSIVLGVRAAMIGFVLVLIFMLIYYKFSGLLACAALILNLVIILAVLAQLRAALTLPGIAGLILTIGMAIDANVLIFERIREELAKAKTVRSAIDSGYERAFTTILDANVTTLITAFVLWQFGTGPIKGFATVLSIGIVASMFTALMCTRVVFELITSRFTLRKLSI
jgi:protein-export membrane protein SecD